MKTVEEMFEDLPIRITKKYNSFCPHCRKPSITVTDYHLAVEVLQIDNRKRYQVYYKALEAGYNPKYIGEFCGIGFKTLAEAIENLKKVLSREE